MQIRWNNNNRFVSSILIVALIIVSLTGCSKKGTADTPKQTEQATQTQQTEQKVEVKALPLDTVLITVDDKDYTLSDMMYVIYSEEEYFNQIAIQYTETDSIDFWNDILDENTNETGREMAEESTLEMMKRVIILGEQAKTAGYQLSSEDQEDIEFYVQKVVDNMDEEHKKRTGFTKENLTPLIERYLLAKSYYQNQVEKEAVDEAKIKDSLKYEDYKQRQVESVFVQTAAPDTQGNEKTKSVEEIATLVKQANQILENAVEGQSLKDAYDSVVTDENADIYYDNLPLSDEDMDEEVLAVVDSLKEGQLYDKLIETVTGYYIVKLIDSNSTELYEDAVLNEIENQKQLSYDQALATIYGDHSIIINEEAWSAIVLETYAYTQREEAVVDDSKLFENSDSSSQDSIILPDDAANGDDGSVG